MWIHGPRRFLRLSLGWDGEQVIEHRGCSSTAEDDMTVSNDLAFLLLYKIPKYQSKSIETSVGNDYGKTPKPLQVLISKKKKKKWKMTLIIVF